MRSRVCRTAVTVARSLWPSTLASRDFSDSSSVVRVFTSFSSRTMSCSDVARSSSSCACSTALVCDSIRLSRSTSVVSTLVLDVHRPVSVPSSAISFTVSSAASGGTRSTSRASPGEAITTGSRSTPSMPEPSGP